MTPRLSQLHTHRPRLFAHRPRLSAHSPRIPLFVVFVAWCFLARALFGQAETTASLGGTVLVEDSKKVVAGARVTLRHAATGDTFATYTNRAGQYLFIGLRPGEFHSMRVTAPGYDAGEIADIILSLGEERQLDVALTDPANKTVHLERMVVVANREHPQPGTATTLTQREVEERPSTDDQTINDYATSDPRIAMLYGLADDDEEGAIAAAGQNVRFNSIQIDGIRLDDQFGLSDSGLPSQGNPFSMETIQSVSVDLVPYDVSRGGFTGAAINAVTKSGDNTFKGSLYYSYRNEKFRAADPVTGTRTPFTNETYGFTLGGPLVKNHLFFFVSWERTENTDPAPERNFEPDPDSVAQIVEIARDKYNYDAGALANPGAQTRRSDRYMAKIDWRINAAHRLSIRHSSSHGGQPNYRDFTGNSETSLSSHWYMTKQNLDAWSAQLFSNWRGAFRTELSLAHQRHTNDSYPENPWPEVVINRVPDIYASGSGAVNIGSYYNNQLNSVLTKTTQGRASATWLLGKHRVQFGGEVVRSDFENTFLPHAWGHYNFFDIDAFEAGTPNSTTFVYTYEGEIPKADWGYTVSTAYLQDTWRPWRAFTLTAGIRVDYTNMGHSPRRNPKFEQAGFTDPDGNPITRNDGTIDGVSTVGPRFSFTWTPLGARRLQIRGGAGVFQGRAPGVWLSNSFTNDGMSSLRVTSSRAGQPFITDINYRPVLDVSGTTAIPINLMSDGLRLPAVTRGNLAVDIRLPWQKMTASVEWLYSRNKNSLVYRDLNLKTLDPADPAGGPLHGPDGRKLYGTWVISSGNNPMPGRAAGTQILNPDFDEVYMLTNAARGKDDSQASYLTFLIKRPVDKHWGFSLAYTRGHATEVSPFTASTASSCFNRRVSIDPNSDETGTAATEVKDRILATLTLKPVLIKKFETTLQFVYDAHSGRPYSFSFANDANGDGSTSNDLFYVPAGRNDPKVYWMDETQKDAFFAYLATNDKLRRFAGQIVPRNSERSRFQHRVDVRFVQQIPFWRTLRAEFVCSILNITNLLNPDWGEVYQYNSPYALAIASGYYDSRTGQYAYLYNNEPREQTIQKSASRWRIQAGVKIKF